MVNLYTPSLLEILGIREHQQVRQAPADTIVNLHVRVHVPQSNAIINEVDTEGGSSIHTGGPAGPGKPSFPRAPWGVTRTDNPMWWAQRRNLKLFICMLINLIRNCYSLQLQHLQDAPSHQADHADPFTPDTTGHFTVLNTFPLISKTQTIILLLTIGPGAPFSPAAPVSPWQER